MGTKHGHGRYTWADGSKFEGDWKDNKIDGKVNSLLIYNISRVLISGLMAETTQVNGKTTTCMVSAFTPGRTGDVTKVNT
jgi:hypothetical protein